MKLENLEAARGFAALYVLLHHLDPLAGTRLQPLLRFGQEAVIMFFLVSGFVIYFSYAKSKGGQTPGEFMWRRALRIYPIFILALGLAVLANAVKGDMSCLTVQDLVGNLLMQQDIARVKGGRGSLRYARTLHYGRSHTSGGFTLHSLGYSSPAA